MDGKIPHYSFNISIGIEDFLWKWLIELDLIDLSIYLLSISFNLIEFWEIEIKFEWNEINADF